MSKIDYEQYRVQSVTQADAAKSLSDKVIELKNLELVMFLNMGVTLIILLFMII